MAGTYNWRESKKRSKSHDMQTTSQTKPQKDFADVGRPTRSEPASSPQEQGNHSKYMTALQDITNRIPAHSAVGRKHGIVCLEPSGADHVMTVDSDHQEPTNLIAIEQPLDLSLPRPANPIRPSYSNPIFEEREERSVEEILESGYIVLDDLPAQAEVEPGEIVMESDTEPMVEMNKTSPDAWSDCDTTADQPNWDDRVDLYPDDDAPWNVAVDPPGVPYELSTMQIVGKVKSEGINHARDVPSWKTKARGYSLHIVHDGALINWPVLSDKKCGLLFERGTSVQQLCHTIRSGKVHFRGHTVVFWLKMLLTRTSEGPIRNALADLVRAVRSAMKEEVRVYISNQPQLQLTHRGLGPRDKRFNKLLEDAVVGLDISHDVPKVFIADMDQQFDESHLPKEEKRNDKYVNAQGSLTYLGCLHYRARLFRELGLAARDPELTLGD